MKKITVADTAGFCFGVNRAVNIAYDVAEKTNNGCTLGPIIHNKEIVKELHSLGVASIDNVCEADKFSTVIIRSHGVSKSVYDKLGSMGVEIIDATCPFVSKIHNIVEEKSLEGKIVLIAGDSKHPEVKGIIGFCNNECYTFNNESDLEKVIKIIQKKKNTDICVVAQTTFDAYTWKKCLKIIKKVYTSAEIFDTICNATSKRQTQADTLSKKSDCMIVIGDRNSSNTNKLYDICTRNCKNTLMIETADDLDIGLLSEFSKIGITAGASTPSRIIKEVLDKMNEEIKSSVNENENFEEMLEESLKSLNTNERVIGTVASIAPNEVYVEVDGRKQTGFIPIEELSAVPIASAEEVVKVGDKLELLIMKTNDQEGTIMLSKKRVDAMKGYETLKKAYEEKEVLKSKVTEIINGGVIVVSNGIRVFIPASQATMNRGDDFENLKDTEVSFRIIEFSQRGRRKKIIGSIKSVLRDEYEKQQAKFWDSCEIGKTYTGVVKTLTPYGAFVDLGGVSGMIHISELSWLRLKHPSEVVNVGDTVEVYIKDINDETKKISLGYKKTEDNPWLILKEQYPVGTVVDAKVVGLTSFGAFANIIPGIDGLIHISQISNKRIEKPSDELKVGDTVTVKIIAIDFENKRVSLSIRELLDPEPEEDTEAETEDADNQEIESAEEEVASVQETEVQETEAEKVEDKEAEAPASEEALSDEASQDDSDQDSATQEAESDDSISEEATDADSQEAE